jgi:hypothetical protein
MRSPQAVSLPLPSAPPGFSYPIEAVVGWAVARAVSALSNAMLDHMSDGKMSAASRELGAQTLAELYELRRAHPSLEFEDVCRVHGKAALREYLATLPDPVKVPEVQLDWLLGWVLKLHAEVVAKRVH